MIDKEAILKDFKEKLYAPIPNFWKASITLGKTTELEYYSKVIVGQTFCNRQKHRLKQRIVKDLKDLWLSEACSYCYFEDKINQLVIKWSKKIK